jgi:hypothetical protein
MPKEDWIEALRTQAIALDGQVTILFQLANPGMEKMVVSKNIQIVNTGLLAITSALKGIVSRLEQVANEIESGIEE